MIRPALFVAVAVLPLLVASAVWARVSEYCAQTTRHVHAREQPTARSEIVGAMPAGTIVTVHDNGSRRWKNIFVEPPEGDSIQGWVAALSTSA